MVSLPLFSNKKEIFYTLLIVVVLFSLSISYEFYKYKNLTAYSLHVSDAKLISHYPKKSKKGKDYEVLKLRSDDFTFYTVSWKPLEIKRADTLKVAFYTKDISFFNYLKGFYANAKFIELKEKSVDNILEKYIENQHIREMPKELYRALFFATPVSQELRIDIAKWGIAHLIAISGFHLGILSGILYFLLRPFYTFAQDRLFPYRNSYADLAFLVFLILGTYTYLIDFTPSILRAYTMSLVGFLLFSRGIKIISFLTLFFTVSIVLILFPKLVFSIAFWLSVSGVFYIFLFLHHFSMLNKTAIFILINFWVYVLMLPIIHYIFDVFSFYHFLSPLISMVFVLFYPLSLALHVSGFGGLLDGLLSWFFSLHVETIDLVTPLWFLGVYLGLSLLAMRFKLFALLLPIFSICIFFI